MFEKQSQRRPRVMVSSTYKDLKQLRDNVRAFLQQQLGFEILMSETAAFPVAPDLDAIRNCLERVRLDADILVLLLGMRYGSIDAATGRSITHLEYREARQKGIPIYAAADRTLVDLIPAWRADPKAVVGEVDNVALFEFLQEVTSDDRVWVWQYTLADEVLDWLKQQLAYLTADALQLWQRTKSAPEYAWVRSLPASASRYALEKPDGWELRLFAETLGARLSAATEVRLALRSIPSPIGLDVDDSFGWLQKRLQDLYRVPTAATKITEWAGRVVAANDAVGMSEAAGALADLGSETARWIRTLQSANIEEDYRELADAMSAFGIDFLDTLVAFPGEVHSGLDLALASEADADGNRRVPLTLTIRISDEAQQRLTDALERLRQRRGW